MNSVQIHTTTSIVPGMSQELRPVTVQLGR